MSEASGRKAQDSAEKPDVAKKIKEGYVAGETAAAAVVGAGGLGYAIARERTRRRLDKQDIESYRQLREHIRQKEKTERTRIREEEKTQKIRRANRAASRRRGGGGGGAFVTPDAATRRDVSKRFRRN